jgi:membrane protein
LIEYLKNKIESILNRIKKNPAGGFMYSLLNNIGADKLPEQAVVMTYYLLLALFPFLIFVLGIFSYTSLTIEYVSEVLATILPMETVELILGTVEEVLNNSNSTLFSFAIIGAIWSMKMGASSLINGVNRAYGVRENRNFIIKGLIDIFVIISIPLFAFISFLLIGMGRLIIDQFDIWFDLPMDLLSTLSTLRYLVPALMLLVYFTLFYRFVPNLRLSFRRIFVGALFTTFGWIGTSMLFSLYINNIANYTLIYGSLGSIVALLLWINLTSMIILIGAEINFLVDDNNKEQ